MIVQQARLIPMSSTMTAFTTVSACQNRFMSEKSCAPAAVPVRVSMLAPLLEEPDAGGARRRLDPGETIGSRSVRRIAGHDVVEEDPGQTIARQAGDLENLHNCLAGTE